MIVWQTYRKEHSTSNRNKKSRTFSWIQKKTNVKNCKSVNITSTLSTYKNACCYNSKHNQSKDLQLECPVTLGFCSIGGPGSIVIIATGYRMDGPGIKSWWGRDFLHLSRLALGPTQPPVQWVPGSFPGVKSSRGMALTPQPLLVSWSRKGRAIPLRPLWAIRPVQSLSACTRVHFTFFFPLLLFNSGFVYIDVAVHNKKYITSDHNMCLIHSHLSIDIVQTLLQDFNCSITFS